MDSHLSPTITPGGWATYDECTLNNWLAQSASGYATPPTVASIMDGSSRLLTRCEVQSRITGVGYDTIKRLARLGRLPTLKLSPHLRMYDASAIEALANRSPYYALADVRKILAVRHPNELRKHYLATQQLRLTADPLNRQRQVVLHADLAAFLPQLLPAWIDPEDWIVDRMADPQWPMRTLAAAAYTAKDVDEIRDLIASDRLDYIWTPSKSERRIPADALLYYVEQEPVSLEIVAHVYGVTYETARSWKNGGQLTCTTHQHANSSLLCFACLMHILRANNPAIKPVLFYKMRLRSKKSTLNVAAAAQLAGVSADSIIAAERNGRLVGVTTPIGSLRFSESAVVRFKRQR